MRNPCLITFTLAAMLLLPAPSRAIEAEADAADQQVLKRVGEVVRKLRDAFPAHFKSTSAETLFLSTVNGLLEGVDSSGLSYIEKKNAQAPADQQVPGIWIRRRDGVAVVAGVVPHTPAYGTGLQPGDLLLRVNDQFAAGLDLGSLDRLLAGAAGSTVKLKVFPLRGKESRNVEIRRTPPASHVFTRTIGQTVGFVQIDRIDASTTAGFAAKLAELTASKIRGLVLDLRNTSGGTPQDAVAIADPFLSGPTEVVVKVQAADQTTSLTATTKDKPIDLPMIVLQNSATTGAAELVIACLQDSRRAMVIGEKSHGHTGIEIVTDLEDGFRVHALAAGLFSPSGRPITGQGNLPDIAESLPELTEGQLKKLRGEFSLFCQSLPGTAANPLMGEPEVKAAAGTPVPAGGEEATAPETPAASPGPAPAEGEEPGVDPTAPDEGAEDAEGGDGEEPSSDQAGEGQERTLTSMAEDYPMLKRYDSQLMRAVNLLISTTVFFDQFLRK